MTPAHLSYCRFRPAYSSQSIRILQHIHHIFRLAPVAMAKCIGTVCDNRWHNSILRIGYIFSKLSCSDTFISVSSNARHIPAVVRWSAYARHFYRADDSRRYLTLLLARQPVETIANFSGDACRHGSGGASSEPSRLGLDVPGFRFVRSSGLASLKAILPWPVRERRRRRTRRGRAGCS